jgi:hypothetical protein
MMRRYPDAVRTTVQIDDDVLEAARQIAAVDGRSLGRVISDLARRALMPATVRSGGGFPTFDVGSDAPPITPEHVARALDED